MRPGRVARRLLQGAGILLAVLVLAAGGAYVWLRVSQPPHRGLLTVAGLSGEVTIARDANGVPHISATTPADAFFGLGFAQAEDRLTQMDLLRRYGEGRISAMAGGSTLKVDRFMRILGLQSAAELQFRSFSPSTQKMLEAYAAGVNAYISRRSLGAEPIYLAIPGPRPWRPADTLVIGEILSFNMSQNYRREIEHALIAERVGPAGLAQLYPRHVPSGVTPMSARIALYRQLPLAALASLLPRSSSRGQASNNWVVDGAHSATGKPILENDPHVAYTAPATLYLAQVQAPGLDLTGAFLPGVPFMILGHNARIGWGFTETGGDVEDLFVEKVDPANPDLYLTPQGWRPFETRREVVKVRGGKDVPIVIRATRHGPVISDAIGSDRDGPYVLALEATFLQPGDKAPQAFWEMDQATDWTSFRQALRDYTAPQMNMVYADVGGTIGFFSPAKVPIRRTGRGWAPTPGWTGEGDWIGYIPFGALPQNVDPASGRFVSANNRITPPDYPYFLSEGWAPGYRAERINQLLDAAPRQTVASTEAMTQDTVSLAARALTPLLLRARPDDKRAARAERILTRWNGDMASNEAAPLIFEAWTRALTRNLFKARLGPAFNDYWRLRPRALATILQTQLGCAKPGPSPCARVVSSSLDEALLELSGTYGTDPRNWRWGRAHPAVFSNLLLGEAPVIGDWTSPRIPAGGDAFAINTGQMDFSRAGHPYEDNLGPSLRMVLDFSDLANSRFQLAPGECEDLVSACYGDLVRPWSSFRWMALDRAKPVARLVLRPAPRR